MGMSEQFGTASSGYKVKVHCVNCFWFGTLGIPKGQTVAATACPKCACNCLQKTSEVNWTSSTRELKYQEGESSADIIRAFFWGDK